jgi:hypothetical protein
MTTLEEAKKLASSIEEDNAAKLRMQRMQLDLMAGMQEATISMERGDSKDAAASFRKVSKSLRGMADEYDRIAETVESELTMDPKKR